MTPEERTTAIEPYPGGNPEVVQRLARAGARAPSARPLPRLRSRGEVGHRPAAGAAIAAHDR